MIRANGRYRSFVVVVGALALVAVTAFAAPNGRAVARVAPEATVGGLTAAVWLVAAALFGMVRITDIGTFIYGLSLVARIPFMLVFLAVPLSITLAIVTGLGWWRREGSVLARAYRTAVALAALVLIPWAAYWNVL